MDDKAFKKHLKDLAHGHHHPEEHDWAPETGAEHKTGNSPKPHRRGTAKGSTARRTRRSK